MLCNSTLHNIIFKSICLVFHSILTSLPHCDTDTRESSKTVCYHSKMC